MLSVGAFSMRARRCCEAASNAWYLPSSGGGGFPSRANEAAEVADVFAVGRDLPALVVDFAEPPELELVWRLRDGIGVLCVDLGCKGCLHLVITRGTEWQHVVVDESVTYGVDFHGVSMPPRPLVRRRGRRLMSIYLGGGAVVVVSSWTLFVSVCARLSVSRSLSGVKARSSSMGISLSSGGS